MARNPVNGRGSGLEVETFAPHDDRYEFFRQLSFLWNGEQGRNGQYMFGEKLLTWEEAFGYLDQEKIEQLHASSDGCLDYVKTSTVGRQQVRYDLTDRGRKKLFEASQARDPCGDPLESLEHRLGVFLGYMMWGAIHGGGQCGTYYDIDGYTLDVLGDAEGRVSPVEVVTHHNNFELYRETYRKLQHFEQEYTAYPRVIFSDRRTAYRFFNHLYDRDMLPLPNGRFNSDPRIEWGQDQLYNAYWDHDDVPIMWWSTITKEWNAPIFFGWDNLLSHDW